MVRFEIYGPIEELDYWEQIKSQIAVLPENIEVIYKGAINHNDVDKAFVDNHFLFFPTLNENFGHVIVESFSSGCPVIISNMTPWLNLDEKKVGWDIDLSDRTRFVEVLNKCGAMSQEEYNVWSESAYRFAEMIKINREVIEQNRLLFSN